MKTINYIISLIFIASLMICTSSCSDEDEGRVVNTKNRVQFTLRAPGNQEVSPMSKSGEVKAVNETIKDVCVLIYKNGQLTSESFYDTDGGHLTAIQSTTNGQSYTVDLEDGESRTVYVVANLGDMTTSWKKESDISEIYKLQENLPQFVLFADGKIFSAKDQTVVAELKRLYAKITVVVNTKGLNKGVSITPTSVELKNFPAYMSVSRDDNGYVKNKIQDNPKENIDYIAGGYKLVLESTGDKEFGSHTGSAFYMYENMQPDGTCLGTNQAYKTPRSIGDTPTKDPGVVSKNKTCSYIEVSTNYVGTGSGTVKYRFFLGKDALTNFEVERNWHYKITLTMSGDGGIEEASWRVETNIMNVFTPYDAYVGYMVNSKSRVYVDLGSGMPIDGWKIMRKSGNDIVDIDNKLKQDGDKYYFEVTAKETNVSDRSANTGVYTISNSNKGIASKDVKITQVIRILDPIAYYHQNTNTKFQRDVVVKVFEKSPSNFYVPLSSVGAWTVERTFGDWFTLSKHKDQSTDNTVVSKNNVITGEGGLVKFHFDAKALGNAATRYGCITVKYHNNMCEHKIYLRQGGGDTELIKGQAKWAYSNVMEKGKNGTYATQPGPMFAGGNSDELYNSYDPGYYMPMAITGKDRYKWGSETSTTQGPCPEGYVMPSVRDMSVLKKACYSEFNKLTGAVGYIYDDDSETGWSWVNNQVVVKSQYHSNPAKGIVLVNNSSFTNLVFPFGNGVLEHDKVPKGYNNEMDTGLDEIGVGFRDAAFDGSLFSHEDLKNGDDYASYNGNYWSGTPGNGGIKHMCYMKFWYFLKRNVPIYVSDGSNRWGDSWQVDWSRAEGVTYDSGMFVRCVRTGSSKLTTYNDYWLNSNW